MFKAKEIRAFNATLPEHKQDEIFECGRHRFDVTKAKMIIKRWPSSVFAIDVARAAPGFNKTGEFDPESDHKSLSAIDKDLLWFEVDMTEPIILLDVKLGKRFRTLLIDGNHRFRKAFLLKQSTIFAYWIAQDFQKDIQVK